MSSLGHSSASHIGSRRSSGITRRLSYKQVSSHSDRYAVPQTPVGLKVSDPGDGRLEEGVVFSREVGLRKDLEATKLALSSLVRMVRRLPKEIRGESHLSSLHVVLMRDGLTLDEIAMHSDDPMDEMISDLEAAVSVGVILVRGEGSAARYFSNRR